MLNIIVCLILFCYVTVSSAQSFRRGSQLCTDERRAAANLCSDKLFFAGKNSRKYPETQQLLDKHCKETTELVRCVSAYTDHCHQGVHHPTASVMLSTVRHNQRTYCNRPNKRLDMISLGVCGNAIRTQTSQCVETFLMDMGRASHSRRPNKIPHGCCSFFHLKQCVMTAAERLSGSQCTAARRQLLERYMDSMAGNSVNMLCGQYDEDSDRCERLPPLPTGKHIASAPSIFTGFSQVMM